MSSICCAAFPPAIASSHPVDVGFRSEVTILRELVHRGYSVSIPFSTNQRYDLIVDVGDRLLKVQCKTGRIRNGAIEFNTISIRTNMHKVLTRGYDGEIDYFAVYCPQTDGIYFVPIEEARRGKCYLRVAPATNNQSKRIRWASDYELPPFRPPADADLDSGGTPV